MRHLGRGFGRAGPRRLVGDFDLRQFRDDFLWTGNHARRAERKRLRNHMVEVLLHDEQFIGDVTQVVQDKLDLFYRRGFAQVGVDHQDAVRDDGFAAISQHLGHYVMFRPQHRADRWYFFRLIG